MSREGKEIYKIAMRSIRIWPVTELTVELEEDCRSFIENILGVPTAITADLDIELTRGVSQPRWSKIHEEVVVHFSSTQQRDLVQPYVANLEKHIGKAGL